MRGHRRRHVLEQYPALRRVLQGSSKPRVATEDRPRRPSQRVTLTPRDQKIGRPPPRFRVLLRNTVFAVAV
jgi:hypothetical protein